MKLMKVLDNNLCVKLQPIFSILVQSLVIKLVSHSNTPILDIA